MENQRRLQNKTWANGSQIWKMLQTAILQLETLYSTEIQLSYGRKIILRFYDFSMTLTPILNVKNVRKPVFREKLVRFII